jgi:hypothetical protein
MVRFKTFKSDVEQLLLSAMTIATQRWIHLLANTMTVITIAVAMSFTSAHAHRKGIYASEAEALTQAEKIGCTDVHQNNGRWMPCANERELHQQMRRQ